MSDSNTDEEITNTDDELLVSSGRSGFSGRRYAWSQSVKLVFQSDVPRSIEWKIRKNRSTKVFEKLKSTGRHKHIRYAIHHNLGRACSPGFPGQTQKQMLCISQFWEGLTENEKVPFVVRNTAITGVEINETLYEI